MDIGFVGSFWKYKYMNKMLHFLKHFFTENTPPSCNVNIIGLITSLIVFCDCLILTERETHTLHRVDLSNKLCCLWFLSRFFFFLLRALRATTVKTARPTSNTITINYAVTTEHHCGIKNAPRKTIKHHTGRYIGWTVGPCLRGARF
jgi:hypothetical protein